MNFGEKLALLRKKKGISQEKLAEKMETSVKTIRRWEYDNISPNVNQLKRLCEALEVSADYLLFEDNVPPLETAQEEISVAKSENKQAPSTEKVRVNKGKVAGLIAIIGVAFSVLLGFFIHDVYKEFFAEKDETLICSVSSFYVNWSELIPLLIAIVAIIIATIVLVKYILKIKRKKENKNFSE